MDVTVPIPDGFAARFGSAAELGRRALEALALEEFRAGRLNKVELRQLLGFETRAELDGFLLLKARGLLLEARSLLEEYTLADLDRERQVLDQAATADDLVARFRAFRADKTLGGLDALELIREGRR